MVMKNHETPLPPLQSKEVCRSRHTRLANRWIWQGLFTLINVLFSVSSTLILSLRGFQIYSQNVKKTKLNGSYICCQFSSCCVFLHLPSTFAVTTPSIFCSLVGGIQSLSAKCSFYPLPTHMPDTCVKGLRFLLTPLILEIGKNHDKATNSQTIRLITSNVKNYIVYRSLFLTAHSFREGTMPYSFSYHHELYSIGADIL